ncbi:MAG TPA: helix-turn-helix domain-containing protein [Acidimicrobiales bacterium]|nr:helix-turn-helix domain-containing protein [Acidimicrobiales bacterium]
MTVEKVLLTPEEAAEALSLGRTKVYELIRLGVLRSVRIGKCRRVPAVALSEFVDRLSGAAVTPQP